MLNRRDAFRNPMATGLGISAAPKVAAGARRARSASPQVETLDIVHADPGEPAPDTRYLDPAFLARRRCAAIVIEHAIEGVPLLTAYDPTLNDPVVLLPALDASGPGRAAAAGAAPVSATSSGVISTPLSSAASRVNPDVRKPICSSNAPATSCAFVPATPRA
jgi:hypothetical protein